MYRVNRLIPTRSTGGLSRSQIRNVGGLKSPLAKRLGVIQQTVNAWISDISGRRRAGREIIIIRLSRLSCPPSFLSAVFVAEWGGWSQEQIAEVVGISRGRLSQIVNNTNFGKINTLLSRGWDMDYIASHYHMDPALARPPRLKAKPMAGTHKG